MSVELMSAIRRAKLLGPAQVPQSPSVVPTKMTFLTVAEKIRVIQKYVAGRHGMAVKRMLSASLYRENVRARQLGIYFAMTLLDCGGGEISRRFGGTELARHSVRIVKSRMDALPMFASEVAAMRAELIEKLKPRPA